MQIGEDIINSIISKAEALGLVCQINEHHKWIIYLNENSFIYQTESGWLSPIQGSSKIFIENSDLLDIFKHWQQLIYI